MAISAIKILKVGKTFQKEFLTIKGGSLCQVDFPALVGLFIHDKFGPVLFDTGYDNEFFTATSHFPEKLYAMVTPVDFTSNQSLPKQLEKRGFEANDVKAIVLSHFHGDHIAGLKNYPNAKIYCAKDGLKAVKDGSRFQLTRHGYLPMLLPDDIAKRAIFFEDLEPIDLGNEFAPFEFGIDIFGDGSCIAIELKGHCKGHYGLIARVYGEKPYFFIGDSAWSINAVVENRPPPEFVVRLLGDKSNYEKTLSNLSELSKSAGERVEIIPSHCQKIAQKLVEE